MTLGGFPPEPIRNGVGATIMGPRNVPLEQEKVALLASPDTDAGTVPNLKFSYAAAHNRLLSGGWARQITIRELPIATDLAGVNMRLTPGGIRELHWHKTAEWAYLLAGRARITAVDPNGRNFIDDLGVGDLWNFPAGIPHSIQALEDGCEFLLVFDNGSFSENETFLITDWFARTRATSWRGTSTSPSPRSTTIPFNPYTRALHLLGRRPAGAPPGRGRGAGRGRPDPASPTCSPSRTRPRSPAAGSASSTHPTSRPRTRSPSRSSKSTRAALRERHWHPNPTNGSTSSPANAGCRLRLLRAAPARSTSKPPTSATSRSRWATTSENTGDEPLRFLEMFRSDRFADISLSQWMALVPRRAARQGPPQPLLQTRGRHRTGEAQARSTTPAVGRARRPSRSARVAGDDDRGARTRSTGRRMPSR